MALRLQLPALQFLLTGVLLVFALLLGGGQGTLGDSLCQMLALTLLAICLQRHLQDPYAKLPPIAWLAVLPLVVPAIQLLPLPQTIWSLPEVRQEIASQLAVAGVESDAHWTLVRMATERAGLWLLPAVAMFLACLQLRSGQRNNLLIVLVVLATLSALVGLAQLAGGSASPLRFYQITNETEAVGFFANRNHFASLLAVTLPMVVVGVAMWSSRREDQGGHALVILLAGVGLVALLILGIAMARSRAGLLLGMLGLLASLPVALSLRRGRGTRRALLLAVGLGFTMTVQFALFGILQRLEKDPLDDERFQYLPVAIDTARAHAPWGAGLGGFRRAFEARDIEPGNNYVNHAHNDYVELWLDAGYLLLLPVGAAVVVAVASRRRRSAFPEVPAHPAPAIFWVGAIGLAILALHSLGDYPLRTTSMLVVAGLLAGCLLAVQRPALDLPMAVPPA